MNATLPTSDKQKIDAKTGDPDSAKPLSEDVASEPANLSESDTTEAAPDPLEQYVLKNDNGFCWAEAVMHVLHNLATLPTFSFLKLHTAPAGLSKTISRFCALNLKTTSNLGGLHRQVQRQTIPLMKDTSYGQYGYPDEFIETVLEHWPRFAREVGVTKTTLRRHKHNQTMCPKNRPVIKHIVHPCPEHLINKKNVKALFTKKYSVSQYCARCENDPNIPSETFPATY